MKLSVIVPIYKVEDEIQRCLDSIFKQTYLNIELILVNDCTPDNSFNIAKKLVQENGFLEKTHFIAHEKNLGISIARNTGIKSSTGDYLFFIDSDDAIADDTVFACLMDIVESRKNLDILIGGFNRINEEGIFNTHQFIAKDLRSNREVYLTYSKEGLSGLSWGKVIRRAFIVENHLYFEPDLYHEDLYWSFNTYRKADSIIVTNQIIYNYYFRENSITANIGEKNIRDLVTVSLLVYQKYRSEPGYYPMETSIVIENLRRQSLSYLMNNLSDKAFVYQQIERLKTINIPLFQTKKTSLLRLNILLRLPLILVVIFLSIKKINPKNKPEK